MERSDLYTFIRQNRYAVVSSIAADGSPQSALVGIASTPSLTLIFDTLRSTRKYPNLSARPRCSAVVGWSGEQTLQMEGNAEELRGEALAELQKVYFDQWPECRAHLAHPDIVYLAIYPTWLRYSDYDQNPPLVEEIRLDEFRSAPQDSQMPS